MVAKYSSHTNFAVLPVVDSACIFKLISNADYCAIYLSSPFIKYIRDDGLLKS